MVANQTRDITIPLSAGQREDIDPKVASMFQGQPIIKSALNLLLRRDGRLGVRNGIAQLNGFAGGGVHIQDVASCGGRLFGLGVFANGSILDGEYELFEYTNATTGTSAWRSSSHSGGVGGNAGVQPLNQCSWVRELASLGQVAGGVRNMDCAAGNGYVCLAYRATSESETRINIYNATTAALVYASGTLSPTDMDVASVVCCDGGAFLIAGVNTADGSVSLYKFDPATDTTLVTATDLFAAGAAVTAFAFAPVVGATGVAIGYIDRGAGVNATIHRCNTSGTLVGTDISIAGTNTIGAALVSDNTNAHLITVESGGVASLSTYLLSSGALTTGPTALFGSAAIVVGRGSPTVELTNLGFANPGIFCGGQSTDANDLYITRTQIRSTTGHALTVAKDNFGASLETRAVATQLVSTSQGHAILWGSTMGGYAGHASDPRNNALWGYGLSSEGNSVGYHARLDPLEGDIGTGVLGCQGGFKDRVTNNIYWCARRVLPGGSYSGVLYEARASRDDRRQMVPIPGGVFVPGGNPQVFDDTSLSDAGGFPDIPDIVTLSETTGGSMTALGVYDYVLVWEYVGADRRRYRSQVSASRRITLTGINNRVSVRVSMPHSRRGNAPEQVGRRGGRIIAVLYRTVAGGEIFRRASEAEFSFANYGLSQAFFDGTADSALGEILYTSGDTGGLSGVFEDTTPFPCASVTVGKECIATCRLPNPRAYQLSKPYEPLAPARWSDEDAFFGEAPDPLLALRFMDERLYLFAENAVYVASGSPPSVAGIVEGEELIRPQLLTSQCGIIDVSGRGMEWRSILEDGQRLWWQSDTDKLMAVERGGAVPEWLSRPVQSTMALFPVVTGAACQTDDFTASWSLSNVALNDSVVIVRDARTGDWFVHEYNQTIVALCEHQDKLVFATASGAVFQQTSGFVDGASTFIPTTLELNTLYPAGPGGEGRIHWVELLAEFRGDCVLEGFISFDDGVTYTSLGAVTLTTAGGYVAGQTILYQKGPARQKCSGFRLRFNVTTAGSATEGLVFNLVRCQVMATTGPARRRLAA